jgi:mutator protein MutT
MKPHFQVTAGIIRRDGRLLITRRPEGSHLAGMWEFPGGKQEPGETLEACLAREIGEELGVEIRVGERIRVVEHEYEEKRVTLHFFLCELPDATGVRGLQGQELRWVRPEELTSFRFPPPDHGVIEHLQARGGPS